jgi:hypothetical protein
VAIIFDSQEKLDAYVKRVILAQIDVNEQSALKSVEQIKEVRDLAPAAIDAIKIAVRVVIAVQRSSLVLPLPKVPT